MIFIPMSGVLGIPPASISAAFPRASVAWRPDSAEAAIQSR